MNISLFPFSVLWMLLSAVVVGLIAYRAWVAKDEDDTLHVMDAEVGLNVKQAAVAQKLEVIDHWGKTLTVVALVSGMVLGSVYLYQNWAAASAQFWG
jgi:hypothetical protein